MAERFQDRKFVVTNKEKCTGCGLCEYVCSMVNEKTFNPDKSRIRVIRMDLLNNVAVSCRKCEDPLCVAACPKNALSQEISTGIIRVNERVCVGCGWCVGACPFGALHLHHDKKVTYVCNSCTDTDSKGEPQCVQWCPEKALQYVTSETLAQKTRQKLVAKLFEPYENNSKENCNT